MRCAQDVAESGTPIFDDVELVSASYSYSGETFTYSFPDEVVYIVLGVFNAPIETDGKIITNMNNLKAGSRTGHAGFFRNSLSKTALYTFSGNDFTTTQYTTGTNNGYCAVWGYDKWGTLTHASNSFSCNVIQ